MNNFESVIEDFKKEEKPNDIFLLVDYPKLRTVCSLWPKITITNIGNKSKPPNKIADKWLWLWEHINYDIDILVEATGYNDDMITEFINRLKASRLIYPDNTIHKFADSYLEGIIASSFNELRQLKTAFKKQ